MHELFDLFLKPLTNTVDLEILLCFNLRKFLISGGTFHEV